MWSAINDGQFGIALDGTVYDIDGVDLSGCSTMSDVADALQTAINAEVGAGEVELRFTDGGAFQLRAPNFPSGSGYGIQDYAGTASGTDLVPLFNLESADGSESYQGAPDSTIFNRNMYLSHGFGNTTVRSNIDANGASGGVQLRMGGVCDDNLFIRNPISIVFGSSQNNGNEYVGGTIRNNVILGGRDIDQQVQGTGITITSTSEVEDGTGHSRIRDLDVSGNIFAHQELGTGNVGAIKLQGDAPHENLTIHDNIIYQWAKGSWPDPMDQRAHGFVINCVASSSGVELFDNILQQPNGGFLASSNNDAAGASLHDNTYWSTAPDPPDTWSRGWFALSGSVPMSEWLATTGRDQRRSRADLLRRSRSDDRDLCSVDWIGRELRSVHGGGGKAVEVQLARGADGCRRQCLHSRGT